MGEAGLKLRAGFMAGRAGFQGVLGLVPPTGGCNWALGPLVGRGVSGGSRGLMGSLDSCVLTAGAVSPPS